MELTLSEINQAAIPLTFDAGDYDPLLRWIGDRRVVMIGEASHGTHDFYRERARITRRLIEEKGFNTVTIEGDWPDAYRVNRYVRSLDDDATSHFSSAFALFQSSPHSGDLYEESSRPAWRAIFSIAEKRWRNLRLAARSACSASILNA